MNISTRLGYFLLLVGLLAVTPLATFADPSSSQESLVLEVVPILDDWESTQEGTSDSEENRSPIEKPTSWALIGAGILTLARPRRP